MRKRYHSPDAPPGTHEPSYHARRAVYSLGYAAAVGGFEPYTNNTVAAVSGGLVIALATGNAVRHGYKFISASRKSHKPKPNYPQFQYAQQGFSDRYNAEVEYLAYRIAGKLDEQGVRELATIDIDLISQSNTVAAVRKDLFETRLREGYELSYHQMNAGFYGAAQSLGILK